MRGQLHPIDFGDQRAPSAVDDPGVSPRAMESLWVRLKAGDRIRPRDAQLLRRLSVPPFVACGVYELDACGYVVAVGLPDASERLDAARLLSDFESVYGIPTTFSGPLAGDRCKAYGT